MCSLGALRVASENGNIDYMRMDEYLLKLEYDRT